MPGIDTGRAPGAVGGPRLTKAGTAIVSAKGGTWGPAQQLAGHRTDAMLRHGSGAAVWQELSGHYSEHPIERAGLSTGTLRQLFG